MDLKKGYYLAAYIEINEMAHVYDVDTQRHDQNISLWYYENNNLTLKRYWELERVTRIKHHNKAFKSKEHAIEFINSLLLDEGLTIDDIEYIIGCQELSGIKDPVNESYYYHSMCHLFSALLLDTEKFANNKILAFSMDLDSDCLYEEHSDKKNDYVGCFSDKGKISLFSIESPAPLWSIASHDKKIGEGTLMALASASNTRYKADFDFSKYNFYSSSYKYNQKVYSIIKEIEKRCNKKNYQDFLTDYDERFSFEDNLTSATMKIVQKLSEEIVERNIERAMSEFNTDRNDVILAMSGGFALNCPCNSIMMTNNKFKEFIAPPCVNDSGQSLGMALYFFYQNIPQFNFKFENAFYGNDYQIDDIVNAMSEYIITCEPASKEQFIKDITNDSIIWFDGKSEIGPRALGHRSLLSSPNTLFSKNRLNEIKKRQYWRPVAPIVLDEYASEYFDDVDQSPYMLRTFVLNEKKMNDILAVAHLDNSSRVQTIGENSDNIAKVIQWYGEHTGIYMLCNTSLNDKGEPIIETPFEAVNFAYKKGMSIIYLCNHRIELDLSKKFNLEKFYKSKWKQIATYENEYPLSKEEFMFFYWTQDLAKLDIENSQNMKLIKRMFNAYSKTEEWKEKSKLANIYY